MILFASASLLLIALLFAVAAIGKLLSGFSQSQRALAGFGVPKPLLLPFSVALPLAEMTVALLLMFPRTAWWGGVAALALLVLFNAAILANLTVGKRPTCNCFGQLHSKPIGWRTFGRNTVLAILAYFVLRELRVHPNDSPWSFLGTLSPIGQGLLAVSVVGLASMGVLGFILLHLFRQNGRLLVRIEALETSRSQAAFAPARPTLPQVPGLPLGTQAPGFELSDLHGGTVTLAGLLTESKPLMFLFSSPNCGPCNALMPDVASWQKSLTDIHILVISEGRQDQNRSKAAEYGLKTVLVEKKRKVAETYHAFGTPTAVIVRQDGTIGSHPISGADAIRQSVALRAWTEAGFATFLTAISQPKPAQVPKAPPVGLRAPEFRLPDLNGRTVTTANFNGTGTILLFWNPACGSCQKMLPQLKEWELRKSESAPRLILVSTGSHEANRGMGLESTILVDDKFAVGQMYGANGTPSALLIDSHGNVASGVAVGAPGVLGLLSRGGFGTEEPNVAQIASDSR